MPLTNLIICLVSSVLSMISFGISHRNQIKWVKRTLSAIAVISFFSAITSALLGYKANIETEHQLQEIQTQVVDIRTPRRIYPESELTIVTTLKPYAGQKYDMKAFRDQDSLKLATDIEAILTEAGWVLTNVYPKSATHYAETRDEGMFLISGTLETRRTAEARAALRDALLEAGLYDDTSTFTPIHCVKTTEPIQVGTQITPIPCSESSAQNFSIDFTFRDDVIPDDTMVLHVGKHRP